MTNIDSSESGFKIESLTLVDCKFSRGPKISSNKSDVDLKHDLQVDVSIKDNQVFVVEKFKIDQSNNDQFEFNIEVTMLGIFSKVGEMSLSLEEFGYVNGAAIIFPYIREQVSNLSLKGGLGNIILPPANFVNLYNNKSSVK
jgi:preprotein translocase subunit SecB